MARRTAIPAMVTAMVLLASACGDGGGAKGSAGANPTLATDPPRTNPTLATVPAPTTTTNPYAVPATIDAAYVNRVLAAIDALMGDAVRLIMTTRTIPREAYDRIRAVYGDDQWFQSSIDSFQADLRKDFSTYQPSPGNKATSVTQLISGHSRCIFARVARDYSGVAASPSPPETQWVALRPLIPSRDPSRYNVTGWALIYDGYAPNRQAPPDPCAS